MSKVALLPLIASLKIMDTQILRDWFHLAHPLVVGKYHSSARRDRISVPRILVKRNGLKILYFDKIEALSDEYDKWFVFTQSDICYEESESFSDLFTITNEILFFDVNSSFFDKQM